MRVSKSFFQGQLFDDQLLVEVKDEDCCTSLICLSGMKRIYGKSGSKRGIKTKEEKKERKMKNWRNSEIGEKRKRIIKGYGNFIKRKDV